MKVYSYFLIFYSITCLIITALQRLDESVFTAERTDKTSYNNAINNTVYYKNQLFISNFIKKNVIQTTTLLEGAAPLFKAPNIPFYDEVGNEYIIKSFNNRLIILYFWAAWCLECTEELVQLNQLQKRLLYEDVYDIIIMPISIDFKSAEALYFLYQSKYIDKIGLFIDKKKSLMEAMHVQFLPTTFLISKHNTVIKSIHHHITWTRDDIYQELMKLKDCQF